MKRQLICTKCKQWFYPNRFGIIPNHNCINDDEDNTVGQINNINYTINVFSSDDSPNIANDISYDYNSIDTSPSDIGGGGDFGGGGASSDW